MFANSRGGDFLSNYYSESFADYLLFTEDQRFKNGDLYGSSLRGTLDALVFANVDGSKQVVSSISSNEKRVDALNEYMMQFAGEYDMRRVALLPNETIRLASIVTYNNSFVHEEVQYIGILNNFAFDLLELQSASSLQIKNVQREKFTKSFQFMLILPRSIIQKKVDEVDNKVSADLQSVFVIPFVSFSLFMMVVTSCCLSRISKSITEPIIELYEKIKLIINFH